MNNAQQFLQQPPQVPQQQQQQQQHQQQQQQFQQLPQDLVGHINFLHNRIGQLEQQQRQPNQPAINQSVSAANEFGLTNNQVTSAWRDLSDSLRGTTIPIGASINASKPRGSSSTTKAEIEHIGKITPVAKVLLQLYQEVNRGTVPPEHLQQAVLITGLHLTITLQQRLADLFVESSFPEASEYYKNLRGPGGAIVGQELDRLTTAIQLANISHQPAHNSRGRGRGNRGAFNHQNNFGSHGNPHNFHNSHTSNFRKEE